MTRQSTIVASQYQCSGTSQGQFSFLVLGLCTVPFLECYKGSATPISDCSRCGRCGCFCSECCTVGESMEAPISFNPTH